MIAGTAYDPTLGASSRTMRWRSQVSILGLHYLQNASLTYSPHVTVLLQAMKQDPPLDTKCRDKFLVQSVNISGDKEFTSVQQIVGVIN